MILSVILRTISAEWLPDCLRPVFMRQALAGLLLIAPMAAALGLHLLHFRMAFYAEAVSHSAFAGVALGLLFAVRPDWAMPVFGLAVGLAIVGLQRRSGLSADAVIGVILAAVMAFGLAIVSRNPSVMRDLARFLYGDILTLDRAAVRRLAMLFPAVMLFEAWSYNRLLYIGVHSSLARAHRVRVGAYETGWAALVALLIMLSVSAVGVLLVTALLIIPAATARNVASAAGSAFWWSIAVAVTSALAGLILSAQPWARTATGPTVVLCGFAAFLASWIYAVARRRSIR